jgi:peptide chain release factor 2/peptide chain release factor
VTKVASAVRAVHRPTGLGVRAAGERSQRANRAAALSRLAGALARRAAAAEAAVERERHAAHHRLVRGAPIRSYRLDRSGALEALE